MNATSTATPGVIASTIHLLRERKALIANANSAQRRYAADTVVRSSAMAPFFSALGVTKGAQIVQILHANLHNLPLFFRTIMRYCKLLNVHKATIPQTRASLVDQLKVNDWYSISEWVTNEYAATMHLVREHYYASMGCDIDRLSPRVAKVEDQLQLLLDYKTDITKLLYKAESINACKDAIVLAVHIGNLDTEPAYQRWLQQNHEFVVEAFIQNGKSRAKLAQCHGLDLTLDSRGFCSTQQTGRDRSCIGGITHAELNKLATAYQDRLQRLMDYIESSQCAEFDAEGGDYPLTTEKEYQDYKTTMESEVIFTTGSLTSAGIPSEVLSLAKRLCLKHGPVRVTSEASGIHIYLPDPDLLQKDGRKELESKHLCINAEKYLGIGRYDIDNFPTAENKQLYKKYRQHGKEVPSTSSMKTGKLYTVDQLLHMPPLERRVANLGEVKRTVAASDPNKHLVYDEQGNLVPEWCGETVPLSSLPTDHPARDYMERQRHYNLKDLETIWDISYCTNALPEDRGVNRFYGRLPGGCKNCPSGRIIIPIYDDMHVRRGWQARVIDFTNAHGDKWVWTDKQEWKLVARSGNDLFTSDEWPKGFAVHKYLNARGSQRNALLFGLYQAVEFNKTRPFDKRYCVLVEGPLDAVRGGAPCIALLGKSMSPEQAALIRKHFTTVCTVMDQDKAGQECLRRIHAQLPGMPIKELTVPAGKKDLGDCTEEEARILVTKYDPLNA